MPTFRGAIVAFLIARAMWDAVKVYARKAGELPLVWLFKTSAILLALVCVVGGLGMFCLYAFALSAR